MEEIKATFKLEQNEPITANFSREEVKPIQAKFVINPTPDKLSQLENDMGYITLEEVPKVDTSDLATKEELNQKQDKISDLSTIRSNASKGATAVQPSTLNSYATIDFVNNTVGNIETLLANINSGS